ARVRGTQILWKSSAKGYRFSPQAYRGKTDAFAADTELRARAWKAAPLRVRERPPRPGLLNAEWIGATLRIKLDDGQTSVTVP
ncbi:type II secretion system minor pseudopilin GspH, partial [Pseudomonas aeruginosa]